MNQTSGRQSNIELLRIAAMMLVLMVHFCGASFGLPKHTDPIESLSTNDWLKLIVESFTIIGVNVFVLISGYFGINTRWESLWKFTLQCLFYSVGIYFAAYLCGIWKMDWSDIADSFLIYTRPIYWFVRSYFGLMIIAPIINAAIATISQRQLALFITAYMIVTFYGGWIEDMAFSAGGYSTANFILLYLIARYIKLYLPGHSAPDWRLRLKYVIGYLVATVLILISHTCLGLNGFAYNSPFVIAASVCFMLFFTTIRFSSRIVNIVAASSFSVYLIHMHPTLWIHIKTAVREAAGSNTLLMFVLWCSVAIIGIFLFCVIIDKVRIFLLRPLEEILSSICRTIQHRIFK